MQFSPGAVGKGHFVINILKNQIIWTVEMGWMVAHGQACWRGRAVAVVILGFCFVLNLGRRLRRLRSGGGGAAAAGGTGMVVPQGRPRCTHREEAAAAAEEGGAAREACPKKSTSPLTLGGCTQLCPLRKQQMERNHIGQSLK